MDNNFEAKFVTVTDTATKVDQIRLNRICELLQRSGNGFESHMAKSEFYKRYVHQKKKKMQNSIIVEYI